MKASKNNGNYEQKGNILGERFDGFEYNWKWGDDDGSGFGRLISISQKYCFQEYFLPDWMAKWS